MKEVGEEFVNPGLVEDPGLVEKPGLEKDPGRLEDSVEQSTNPGFVADPGRAMVPAFVMDYCPEARARLLKAMKAFAVEQTLAVHVELEISVTPEAQDSDNHIAQPEALAWHGVGRRRGRQRGQLKQLKLTGKEVGEEFVNPGLVEDPGLVEEPGLEKDPGLVEDTAVQSVKEQRGFLWEQREPSPEQRVHLREQRGPAREGAARVPPGSARTLTRAARVPSLVRVLNPGLMEDPGLVKEVGEDLVGPNIASVKSAADVQLDGQDDCLQHVFDEGNSVKGAGQFQCSG